MKTTKLPIIVVTSLPLLVAAGLRGAQAGDTTHPAATLLFVQTAEGVEYKKSDQSLTLKDVSPSVIFFTDRPYRTAGQLSVPGFLKIWAEGADSFKKDVPNANGSFTPVRLHLVSGGWQGPKGEVYPTLPTVDQLKGTYGL